MDIEEGKAYATYLEINLSEIFAKGIPTKSNPALSNLSKKIGVNAETISRRVSLLVLPSDIQNMVES